MDLELDALSKDRRMAIQETALECQRDRRLPHTKQRNIEEIDIEQHSIGRLVEHYHEACLCSICIMASQIDIAFALHSSKIQVFQTNSVIEYFL